MSGYQEQVDELYVYKHSSDSLEPGKKISFNFQYVEDDLAISPAKRPELHSHIDEIGSDRPSRHASKRRASLSINDALKNLDT